MSDASIEELRAIPGNADLLEELRERIGRRCVVPFVGAGLSVPFDYPEWGGLLRSQGELYGLLDDVDNELAAGRYEEAAAVLVDSPHSGPVFRELIRIKFKPTAKLRDEPIRGAPKALAALVHGPVVTTNYDEVLERAYEQQRHRFEAVARPPDETMLCDAFSGNRHFLLKIHGHWNEPASRILTLDEYERFYGASTAGEIDATLPLPQALRLMFQGRTVLFLGCSLREDRYLRMLRRLVADAMYTPLHFALLEDRGDMVERRRTLSRDRILPIFFPPGRFELIEAILRFLGEEPETTRSGMAKQARPSMAAPRDAVRDLGGRQDAVDDEAGDFDEELELFVPEPEPAAAAPAAPSPAAQPRPPSAPASAVAPGRPPPPGGGGKARGRAEVASRERRKATAQVVPAGPAGLRFVTPPATVVTSPPVPAGLRAALRERRCIGFIGSGASVDAGLPTWTQLAADLVAMTEGEGKLDAARVAALRRRIDEGGMLEVIGACMQQVPQRVHRAIAARFDARGLDSPTHDLLAKIDFRALLTTNYDTFLETRRPGARVLTPEAIAAVGAEGEAALLDEAGPLPILKIHGTALEPERILFGAEDYQRLVAQGPGYRALLVGLLSRWTLLFFGTSFRDQRVTDLLEAAQQQAGPGTRHYAVVVEGATVSPQVLRDRYGIEAIGGGDGLAPAQARVFLRALARR